MQGYIYIMQVSVMSNFFVSKGIQEIYKFYMWKIFP